MFVIVSLFVVAFGDNNLIIDNDNQADDVIATVFQLINRLDKIKAITTVAGDSFALPNVFVTQMLLDVFKPNGTPIPIGYSDNAGIHPFPTESRNRSNLIAQIPLWKDESVTGLAELDLKTIPSALSVISKALENSADGGADILATGPLTNIAELLTARPDLKKKIARIYAMAGAINVSGGAGPDGTAEWNVYNNPAAFDTVLKSGISLSLIPLDVTQSTPCTYDFSIMIWNFRGQGPHYKIADDLLSGVVGKEVFHNKYYFKDTLTSLVSINPSIVTWERAFLKVMLDGPSEGRTITSADGKAEEGYYPVDIAVKADEREFQNTFLSIFNRTWSSRLASLERLAQVATTEQKPNYNSTNTNSNETKPTAPPPQKHHHHKKGRK